jgi:Sulfotransferase family
MLTSEYRRIYYYHLKKCGGSTLNYWLDTLTEDDRTHRAAWQGLSVFDTDHLDNAIAGSANEASIARTLFHWTDVIHSHAPLRPYAPDKTFCFTVLRDPVQRLISQVSDWKRLTEADTIRHSPEIREYVEDSRRLSLRDFLERHATGAGRMFLDNYLTRALAAGRIGSLVEDVTDPDRLRQIALQSLENDYHLIGLTENLDFGRNAFCAMVGLPPAAKIPTINVTRKTDSARHDLRGARDILQFLTRVDRVVYDRARQLFEQRHRQTAETYDTAEFETRHASGLLNELRATHRAGATCYSVRQPIIGSGFHGRDGAGMPSCAVWTGPETRTTLYVPTPENMPMSLLVWIRGYVDGRQREQLRVRVDGKPTAHHFALAEGYADLLVIPACPSRDFVRLELEIDETLESGEQGDDQYDGRERGIAFDSYGWCAV